MVKVVSVLGRYAWTVFLAMSVIFVLFGITDFQASGSTYAQGEATTMRAVSGLTWSQLQSSSAGAVALVDHISKEDAINELLIGLLFTGLALTAFRHGERWAWCVMWLWPVLIVAHVLTLWSDIKYTTASLPSPLISGPIFLVLSLAALALSYRSSFRQG